MHFVVETMSVALQTNSENTPPDALRKHTT
jgi:hypothetical protein